MLRKLMMMVGVLAFVGAVAVAQSYVVQPTGYGADTAAHGEDTADKGATSAYVDQTVTLKVPMATALHLDVTELMFDLTTLDEGDWPYSTTDFAPYMVCVYGSDEEDQLVGGGFYSQQQVLPLGTLYAVTPNGWPEIEVTGHSGTVTAYPPIQFDSNNELVPGSKNHFVCYRSFILQKFSNGPAWDLTVERIDTDGSLQHIYIQDNPCDTFGQGTGLYELTGTAIRLVPPLLATGPTGSRSCGFTSWLDDLVVVAVKVNADYAGDNEAILRYTLTTTWPTTE